MVLKNNILPVVFLIGMAMFAADTVASLINMPVVYKDKQTKKCVAIESAKGVADCSVIPDKYDEELVDSNSTYSMIKALHQ